MLFWAIDNPPPANYLLISGDRDFCNALHKLSMRRYNILLAHAPNVSQPLVAAARTVWHWKSLVAGEPPLSEPSYIRVSNVRESDKSVSAPASEIVHAAELAQTESQLGNVSLNSQKSGVLLNFKTDNRYKGKHISSTTSQSSDSNSENSTKGRNGSGNGSCNVNANGNGTESLGIASNIEAEEIVDIESKGKEKMNSKGKEKMNSKGKEKMNSKGKDHHTQKFPTKPSNSKQNTDPAPKGATHQVYQANNRTQKNIELIMRYGKQNSQQNNAYHSAAHEAQHGARPKTLPGNFNHSSSHNNINPYQQHAPIPAHYQPQASFPAHHNNTSYQPPPAVPPPMHYGGSNWPGVAPYPSVPSSGSFPKEPNYYPNPNQPIPPPQAMQMQPPPPPPPPQYYDYNYRPSVPPGPPVTPQPPPPQPLPQHNISSTSISSGTVDKPSSEIKIHIETVLRALAILKREKVPPTDTNIEDCIHYGGEIGIPGMNIKSALGTAVEHGAVVKHQIGANSNNFYYVRRGESLWKCVNVMDANVKRSKDTLDAVHRFLSSPGGYSEIMASLSRYCCPNYFHLLQNLYRPNV
jgi:NYN domain